jgi:hypothetical protein
MLRMTTFRTWQHKQRSGIKTSIMLHEIHDPALQHRLLRTSLRVERKRLGLVSSGVELFPTTRSAYVTIDEREEYVPCPRMSAVGLERKTINMLLTLAQHSRSCDAVLTRFL